MATQAKTYVHSKTDDVFYEFLNGLSTLDDMIDLDKMRKIIYDE